MWKSGRPNDGQEPDAEWCEEMLANPTRLPLVFCGSPLNLLVSVSVCRSLPVCWFDRSKMVPLWSVISFGLCWFSLTGADRRGQQFRRRALISAIDRSATSPGHRLPEAGLSIGGPFSAEFISSWRRVQLGRMISPRLSSSTLP